MDRGPGIAAWHPPQDATAMLDGFLDRLAAGGMRIGTKQRLSAHRLLAALILRGAERRDLAYARDMFTSLLATSPDEQRVIASAFEHECAQLLDRRSARALVVETAEPIARPMPLASLLEPPTRVSWLKRLEPQKIVGAAIILLLCGVVVFTMLRSNPSIPIEPNPGPTTTIPTEIDSDDSGNGNSGGGTTPTAGAWTAQELLEDLANRKAPALPTLREIWSVGWPSRSATGERQFSLVEMIQRTGFDPDQPLEIASRTVQDELAKAFSEFVSPLGPNEATVALGGTQTSDLIRVLRNNMSNAIDPSIYVNLTTEPREARISVISGIATNLPKAVSLDTAEGRALLDRAFSVALVGKTLPVNAFADAHWRPSLPTAAHTPPPGLRVLLAVLPLLIYAVWLITLARDPTEGYRRFFARKKPLDHSHLLTAPNQLLSTRTNRSYIKGVAHGLGARQTVGTIEVDPGRTVDRTAKRAGFFDPVPGRITATPAYVFFIEARSPLDLEARRLDLLRERLAAAGLDIRRYFYTQTPAILYERFGGPPLPLDEVAAHDDDRRLIVMGEGAGFVDPATLRPEAWTRALDVWNDRAMLSSKPVGSWGVEEEAIARDLGLPLGRATIEGLSALPELLGLDSEADRPAMRAYGFSGGKDLKPLPLPLRSDPYRWLASGPPADNADDWWPELEYRLSLYLDQAGLDWLRALAVYPAINWELTLYLGRELTSGANREFYAEPRLAALTRLPWLREGRLPEWLRDAMIASLDPSLRKRVIELIAKIVAPETGVDRSIEVMREQNRLASDLGSEPGEDVLFLDTFTEDAESGSIDLPQNVSVPVEREKSALVHEKRMKLLKPLPAALLLAAAACWLTPDATSGMLRTGGYLPVATLFLAAGLGWLIASGWPGKVIRAITDHMTWLLSRPADKTLEFPAKQKPARSITDQPFVYVSYVPEDRERARRLAADLRALGVNLWLTDEHETPKSAELAAIDRAAGILSILTEASRNNDIDVGKPLTIVMLEKVEIEDPSLKSEVLDMTGDAYGGNIEHLARRLNDQTNAVARFAEQAQVAV